MKILGDFIDKDPYIQLHIQGYDIEFIVDTGFSGALSIPSWVIKSLELPYDGFVTFFLADGSVTKIPSYLMDFEIAGVLFSGVVNETRNEIGLIGMQVLSYFDLFISYSKDVVQLELVEDLIP